MGNIKPKYIQRTDYLTPIFVSFVFLLASFLFVFYINYQTKQQTVQYITQAVEQSQFNVDAHIDEEFQTMATGRILSEDREWLANDDSFGRMVTRLLDSNTYTRVGIVSPQGDALWADREGRRWRANLSGEEYIQKALTGENAISETYWDQVSGMYVNNYAIPIYGADGVLRGALFVSDPEDEVRQEVA